MMAFFVSVCFWWTGLFLYASSSHPLQEVACKRFDIRHPGDLEKLSICTVIEGDLFLVFTTLPPKARLPELREISGALLLYGVDNIRTLGGLFPNLTLIRGQTSLFDYSLVIKSTSLQEINLPSLRLIESGGVRVETNDQLCYVNTVNWKTLLRSGEDEKQLLKLQKNNDSCLDACHPRCSFQHHFGYDLNKPNPAAEVERKATQAYCWSSETCQQVCSENCRSRGLFCHMEYPEICCHSQCLAGCYGDGPHMCISCVHFLYGGQCVRDCPLGTLRYLNRRCVTESECLVTIPRAIHSSSLFVTSSTKPNAVAPVPAAFSPGDIRNSSYAILNGSCLIKCPEGYAKDVHTGYCLSCANKCPKKDCRQFFIRRLRDLGDLVGCHSASAIYISLQDGEPELLNQLLETAFESLRFIRQSLRIVRSPAITSLSFLRRVEQIGTTDSSRVHPLVFEVAENDNLRQLWSFEFNQTTRPANRSVGMLIWSDGLIRFAQNRRLCPRNILNLFEHGAIRRKSGGQLLSKVERDLISLTNGDLAYCDWSLFTLNLEELTSSSVTLSWPVGSLDFPRNSSFNGAHSRTDEGVVLVLLFVRESAEGLLNEADRDMNPEKLWQIIRVPCDSDRENLTTCIHLLNDLSPATQYVIYVEMQYPLLRVGARSGYTYFTTSSTSPSPPRFAFLDSTEDETLRLSWIPPVKPNGDVAYYLIWFRQLSINESEYNERNFCLQKPTWDTSVHQMYRQNPLSHEPNNSSVSECAHCPSCSTFEELQRLSSYRRGSDPHPNPHGLNSIWMMDDNDAPLPVKVVSNSSTADHSISIDQVGLLVRYASPEEQSQQHEHHQSVELVQILRGLTHFAEFMFEIQACVATLDSNPRASSSTGCAQKAPWVNLTAGQLISPKRILSEWSACEFELCSARVTATGRVRPNV
ncbi:unnamed protein product [Calicophoron daubneyi]|uniref:receptor protein-tyrosine kinase n=1 Tax=Calicophoron daubneyi TaxID=300641 RepID=A0AAV2TI25_CALDB